MIIFINQYTVDVKSMTTQFIFYQNGHNGQLGLKHGKNAGERIEGEPGSNVMRMMMILS